MTESRSLDAESSAVQTHLKIMQGVIERMANNSRACKFWCITLVSASLVLIARIDRPNYILFSLLPVIMFLILDTYYLALERSFRSSYNAFVRKLIRGELVTSDLYVVKPTGFIPRIFISCLLSFSVYVFYLLLIISVLIIRFFF